MISLAKARTQLGLTAQEFTQALHAGEIWTVRLPGDDTTAPRAMALRPAVERLAEEEEFPTALKRRLELVGTVTGAEALGITRERFVRLAKAGSFRPARWYLNRYRAVVWLYPVGEVCAFAADNPAWLTGALPPEVRSALAEGLDLRACGWRLRRATLLASRAPDAWHEAAVWLTLLGPDQAADLVPDNRTARRLADIAPSLTPYSTGPADDLRALVVPLHADDPVEIAHARLSCASALARAGRDRTGTPTPFTRPPGRTSPRQPCGPTGTVTGAAPSFTPPPEPGPAVPSSPVAGTDPVPFPADIPCSGTVTRTVQRWRWPMSLSSRAMRSRGVTEGPRPVGPVGHATPRDPAAAGHRRQHILRRRTRRDRPKGRE